jgi:hypothetical protein
MPSLMQYTGQALLYAAFAAAIGTLASWPEHAQLPAGSAQIKLAFNHSGARVEDCRRLTAKELSKLPSNKRKPNDCSRERVPITIQLMIDGKLLYEAVLQPSGLSSDGQAKTYQKFTVPAGRHVILALLRDSKRAEGFDYESKFEGELSSRQNLAIDFKAEQGGFLFR